MNEYLQLIIFPIVVGLAIIIAQAVGIWLKNRWSAPDLSLITDDFYPYSTQGIKEIENFDDRIDGKVPLVKRVVSEYPVECIYYHLILKNTGRAVAKNVIVKIEVFNEDGNELDKISQLKLEQRKFDFVDIASNSTEIFDLCYIEAIDKGEKDELFFASIIGMKSRKRLIAHPFIVGTYIIKVYIYADNFKQETPYSLKVTRTVGFSEDSVKIEIIHSD